MPTWTEPKTDFLATDGLTNNHMNDIGNNLKNLDERATEIVTNLNSEKLKVENVREFKVGKGKDAQGVDKDYSTTMQDSLITITDVRGSTTRDSSAGALLNVNLDVINIVKDLDLTSINVNLENNYNTQAYLYGGISLGFPINEGKRIEGNQADRIGSKVLIDVEGGQTYTATNLGGPEVRIIMQQWDEKFCKSKDNDSSDDGGGWGTGPVNTRKVTMEPSTRKVNLTLRRADGFVFTQADIDSLKIVVAKSSTPATTFTPGRREVIDSVEYGILLPSIDTIGVASEIKNGYIYPNVGRYVLDGTENWVEMSITVASGFKVYQCVLPNCVEKVDVAKVSLNTNKYANVKRNDLSSSTNTTTFCLNSNGNLYMAFPTNLANGAQAVKNYFATSDHVVIEYPKRVSTIIPEPLSLTLKATKGSYIVTESARPITLSHVVSFNSKSQIESMQDVVYANTKITFGLKSQLKKLVPTFSMGDNGFLRFPTAFGGLIIQWGQISYSPPNPRDKFTTKAILFPITFPNSVWSVVSGSVITDGNASHDMSSNVHVKHTREFEISGRSISGNTIKGNCLFRWIAIGR